MQLTSPPSAAACSGVRSGQGRLLKRAAVVAIASCVLGSCQQDVTRGSDKPAPASASVAAQDPPSAWGRCVPEGKTDRPFLYVMPEHQEIFFGVDFLGTTGATRYPITKSAAPSEDRLELTVQWEQRTSALTVIRSDRWIVVLQPQGTPRA